MDLKHYFKYLYSYIDYFEKIEVNRHPKLLSPVFPKKSSVGQISNISGTYHNIILNISNLCPFLKRIIIRILFIITRKVPI